MLLHLQCPNPELCEAKKGLIEGLLKHGTQSPDLWLKTIGELECKKGGGSWTEVGAQLQGLRGEVARIHDYGSPWSYVIWPLLTLYFHCLPLFPLPILFALVTLTFFSSNTLYSILPQTFAPAIPSTWNSHCLILSVAYFHPSGLSSSGFSL